MSFDAIAPWYRAIETATFGGVLQRARVALLHDLKPPRRALIVGEGNGRFLAAFAANFPDCDVDCIDASAAMLRLAKSSAATPRVRFVHADILRTDLPAGAYDCVVTNFVLDCFLRDELSRVIATIAASAAPSAQWIIGEFALPTSPLARWLARPVLALMYTFFRVVAGIAANRLTDHRPLMSAQGFHLTVSRVFLAGFVRAERWQRH